MPSVRSLAASVVALGFVGAVAAPSPVYAAAAGPCARAQNYAAQAGAESLRIERLSVGSGGSGGMGGSDAVRLRSAVDLAAVDAGGSGSDEGPGSGDVGGRGVGGGAGGGGAAGGGADAGRGAGAGAGRGAGAGSTLRAVGVGEVRAAMVGTSRTSSAAVGRILDATGEAGDTRAEPLLQQAPPSNADAATRGTPAGQVGPLTIGAGEIAVRARWEAGMACGRAGGESGRSRAVVGGLGVLGSGSAALVRVPEEVTSLSTTALERNGGRTRTVASATVTAGLILLADDKIAVRILRPPSLVTSMTTGGRGEVRYRPALVEVSGAGLDTKRLEAAGEHADITLGPDRHTTESSKTGPGRLSRGPALPLPTIPGLPTVDDAKPESAPASGGPGTTVRISLGSVRKAEKGHAVAARATAINVAITQAKAGDGTGVSIEFGVGLLEAAAVTPGAGDGSSGSSHRGGGNGGLPVTGPGAAGLATTGAAFVAGGAAVVLLTMRGRRPRW